MYQEIGTNNLIIEIMQVIKYRKFDIIKAYEPYAIMFTVCNRNGCNSFGTYRDLESAKQRIDELRINN